MSKNASGINLSVSDLEINKVAINPSEIELFTSNDDFMSLTVELLKEIGILTSITASIFLVDENDNIRLWERDEAILTGHLVRLSKLQRGILDAICQLRREIETILSRCLFETVINLLYLLEKDKEEVFNEYIRYSLQTEIKLLNQLEENIKSRGHEIPIETRMKTSIQNSFVNSGQTIDGITSEKRISNWGNKNIYEKAEELGLGNAYMGAIKLPSHSIHGNWQDLLFFHLKEKAGNFEPSLDWTESQPQSANAASYFSALACINYIAKRFPECDERTLLLDHIEDFIRRLRTFDQLHEEYKSTKLKDK